MSKGVSCIMLVDDNKIDNFFHERVIRKTVPCANITTVHSANEGLEYLTSGHDLPDIIFLDINMPVMSGWDFLKEYKKSNASRRCLIVVMISDFDDPDDEALEAVRGLFAEFRPKPLTKEILESVIDNYGSLN